MGELTARSLLSPTKLELLLTLLRSTEGLEGEVAECGIGLGGTAEAMAAVTKKRLHLFDAMGGELPRSPEDSRPTPLYGSGEKFLAYAGHNAEKVSDILEDPDLVTMHQGLFSETLPLFTRRLAFIHADGDLYQSTKDIVLMADRLMVPGGIMVIDDFEDPKWPGVDIAVSRYLSRRRWALLVRRGERQAVAIRLGSMIE